MLDLFSIFSKGGILLWCFKGAGLLPKEWEAFTPTINELIRSVLLQERAVKKSSWECGQLAVKYKMVTPPSAELALELNSVLFRTTSSS